jgi:hypothetical protein
MEVIEIVNGQPIAHLLDPGKQSPASADPIAVKGADCEIWISEQRYWMVPPGELVVVSDGVPVDGSERVTLNLDQDSTASYAPASFEAKFGTISYDLVTKGEDWGEALGQVVPATVGEHPLDQSPKQQSTSWKQEAETNLDQWYYNEEKGGHVIDHVVISYRKLDYPDFTPKQPKNKHVYGGCTTSWLGIGVCLEYQLTSTDGRKGRMIATLKEVAFRAFFDKTESTWRGKHDPVILDHEQGHLDSQEIVAMILTLNVNREDIINKAGSVEVEVGTEGITESHKKEAVKNMRTKVKAIATSTEGKLKYLLSGAYTVLPIVNYDKDASDPKTGHLDDQRQAQMRKIIDDLMKRLSNELKVQTPL